MRKELKMGVINCEVGEGMFQGERIVSFKIGDNIVSAIVDEKRVQGKNKLEVDIYDQRDDKFLIGIPGETFSTARKVWIAEEKVER